jgi:hypothetical protein
MRGRKSVAVNFHDEKDTRGGYLGWSPCCSEVISGKLNPKQRKGRIDTKLFFVLRNNR